MIYAAGELINLDSITNQYTPNSIEIKIINLLSSSNYSFGYDSIDQLKFELDLRKRIIDTSIALYKSKLSFRVFDKAKCNSHYWKRTHEGGFLLKKDSKPSDAIKDIFSNSSKYGTECSTAIVIIFYGALVNLFPEELFNRLFADIYLKDWDYLDPDLGIRNYKDVLAYLPGDCRYFKNPDVNLEKPEWQGENVIDLGDGTYYGHGIGVGTSEFFINELNKNRKEGAEKSAYLMDVVTRPNFKYLADQMY
jgi:protein-glutamine gamma-glutamyltransferase